MREIPEEPRQATGWVGTTDDKRVDSDQLTAFAAGVGEWAADEIEEVTAEHTRREIVSIVEWLVLHRADHLLRIGQRASELAGPAR